jgi:hypothetical protein
VFETPLLCGMMNVAELAVSEVRLDRKAGSRSFQPLMYPNPNRIAPPPTAKLMPHTTLTILDNFTRGASYSRPERRLRASKASSGELLVKDYDRTSQNHDQKGRHPLVPSQGGREGEQEGRHDGDPRDKRESAMLQTSYASPASYPSSWCPWEAISA